VDLAFCFWEGGLLRGGFVRRLLTYESIGFVIVALRLIGNVVRGTVHDMDASMATMDGTAPNSCHVADINITGSLIKISDRIETSVVQLVTSVLACGLTG
jgi:hypothetical protein